MDKYLLEILKSVNTIIIPGLGALTITNHDTGEIMFMSYLKHDDGKLTQYIVENEGFEELDAKNLIAKYVREIQLTLDKGESYDMFQFGSFIKDGDDIDFKNWGNSTKETTETNDNEDCIDEKPVEKDAEVIPTLIEETSQPIVEDPIEAVKTEEIEEKIEPIVVHLKEETEEPKKELNILEKEERAATAAKLAKLKADKEKPVQRNKKGIAFWMLMTLIVLIVAGGTYFGLNYDRLKQHVPFLADKEVHTTPEKEEMDPITTENETNADTEEAEEIPEAEEPVEDEIIEQEVITPPVASNRTDLPFHIIAGAFSSEANANRLGEKLTSEGYNVKVGPGRGMNLVSIKSFATRNEAQSGLAELKSVAPNAWVYEWK